LGQEDVQEVRSTVGLPLASLIDEEDEEEEEDEEVGNEEDDREEEEVETAGAGCGKVGLVRDSLTPAGCFLSSNS
jgi:hypothetical protein